MRQRIVPPLRGFIVGIVVALLGVAAVAWAVVQNGWVPARADVPASALEKWASRSVLRAIRRDSANLNSPIQPTDDNLIAGVKIYGANCAMCHGASDGNPSTLAQGFFIKPPQLAKDGVEDDPVSETYYKVKHGMRFTPMPAFGDALTDEQAWQVALFLKQMDNLTPGAAAEWKKIPSVAPSAPPNASPSSSPGESPAPSSGAPSAAPSGSPPAST